MGVQRVRCEVGKPLAEQPDIGHNRWHPDIPPIAEVDPGEEVILESPGYDDYQLRDNDDISDVATMDLTRVHPLAGPVAKRNRCSFNTLTPGCWVKVARFLFATPHSLVSHTKPVNEDFSCPDCLVCHEKWK